MSEAAAPIDELPGRPQMAVLWFIIAAVIAGLVAAMGPAVGVRGIDLSVHLMGVVTVFVGCLPLIIDQAFPPSRRHILITLIALSHAVFFAMPVWSLYFPNGGQIDYSEVILLGGREMLAAQIAALAGMCTMLIGYALPFGKIFGNVFPVPTRDWAPDVATGVATLMIPVGLIVYLGSVFGIVPAALGSGALGTLALGTFYGIALLTVIYLKYHIRLTLLILGFALPFVMFINFFSGMKERLFMAPTYVVLAYLVVKRRIPLSVVAIGAGAFILFYPAAEIFRSSTRDIQMAKVLTNPINTIRFVLDETSNYPIREYLSDGLLATASRANSLTITAVVLHDTPSRIPFQGGWTIGYIPLSVIPRAIWPGKPIFNMGQFITDNYGAGPHIESSTGIPWVAEFYMNFGYIGVGVGMLFLGILFRTTHQALFTRTTTIPITMACIIMCYHLPRNVEAFLLSPLSAFIFHLGPLFLLHLLIRDLGHKRTPIFADLGDTEEMDELAGPLGDPGANR